MGASALAEADIVIVGAGTAGCVLANRLSANPSLSVLILEAGEDHSKDPRVYTPARAQELYGAEQLDWAFESEPERELLRNPRPSYDDSAVAAPGLSRSSILPPRRSMLGLSWATKAGTGEARRSTTGDSRPSHLLLLMS
jgi:choline dehydrogenase-like flavoprotein